MTNAAVLQQVMAFVGPPPGREETSNSAAVCSPLALLSGVGNDATLIRDVKKHIRNLPTSPMTLATLADELCRGGPFRVDLADSLSSVPSNNEQLKKDLARDRVIINSHRIQGGSLGTFDEVLAACRATAADLLASAGLQPVAASSADTFTTSLLRQLSRTESAFTSLQCLHTVVDLSSDGDGEEGAGGNTVIVPESVLAEPMMLRIDLLQRKPKQTSTVAKDYCLDVLQQTSTVFRFVDAATMSTKLQLRIIYVRRTYGMLVGGGEIQEKAGSSALVFVKETKTTSRDWNSQH